MDFTGNLTAFNTKISIPSETQIVWVSDLFVEDYVGGAELTSEALIENSPFNVFKLHSKDVTMELLQEGHQKFWIFGNFASLNLDIIPAIVANMKYSVIEYDYKYCQYRSPEKHEQLGRGKCDCHEQLHGKLIAGFYRCARHLWWMSEAQANFYFEKFPFLNDEHVKNTVLSSVFNDRTMAYVKKLREEGTDQGREGWIILGSKSWIKGCEDAIKYCEDNNLKYEVLWDKPYNVVLESLSKAKGHVYLPRGKDTCPRMTIEAKLLGCDLVLNDFVQHKNEEWFNQKEFEHIEQYLYAARGWFWNGIKASMEWKPTVSGYTTTKDCVSQKYPYEASIMSMLNFCDEVVVMDGGSSDGTWEKLEEWAEKEPKLNVYQEKMDWGHPRFAVFDGKLKDLARQKCTMEFCWQCVSGDTMISTPLGDRLITEIKEGDYVLTHKGRFRKVIKTYNRKNEGKINVIKKLGDNRELYITANHPIYCWNKQNNFVWKQSIDYQKQNDYFCYPFFKGDGTEIKSFDLELSRGKHETYIKNIKIDYDLGFLIGLYLGDGWVSKNKGDWQYVSFSCDPKYENIIKRLVTYLKQSFEINVCIPKTAKECRIQIGNKKFAKWIYNLCGTGSLYKKINESIFNWPKDAILGILDGLYQSDGSNSSYELKIDSVNLEMLSQLKILFSKCEYFGSLRKLKFNCYKTSYNSDNKFIYRLSFSGTQLGKILKLIPEKKQKISNISKQFFKIKDNYFVFSAFSSVDEENFSDYVYNLEVEEDNSYIANGIIVHNCDADEVVHDQDGQKIIEILMQFPPNLDLIALPVIEYWGGEDKVRCDINPWKWRVSRNKKNIGHGIPKVLRRYDEKGELYSAPGSDGCDYIDRETGEQILFGNFYTQDVEILRRNAQTNKEALDGYEKWFNMVSENIPGVFHFSWWDISRKIKTFQNYWGKHWKALYNLDVEDTAENNVMFDVPWSEVTDEMIDEKAQELAKKTGGWIFHNKWSGEETCHISCNRELPSFIKDWVG
jgi:intein/homing endonuclease